MVYGRYNELVNSHFTMVYGRYNELVNGAYKPTNITFGGTILQYHIICSGFPSATITGKMESIDPHLKGDPKGRSCEAKKNGKF